MKTQITECEITTYLESRLKKKVNCIGTLYSPRHEQSQELVYLK